MKKLVMVMVMIMMAMSGSLASAQERVEKENWGTQTKTVIETVTIADIKACPEKYEEGFAYWGIFKGWQAEDLQAPGIGRSDWIFGDDSGKIYVTGAWPGKFDPVKDVGKEVSVIGKARKTKTGIVYIEAKEAVPIEELKKQRPPRFSVTHLVALFMQDPKNLRNHRVRIRGYLGWIAAGGIGEEAAAIADIFWFLWDTFQEPRNSILLSGVLPDSPMLMPLFLEGMGVENPSFLLTLPGKEVEVQGVVRMRLTDEGEPLDLWLEVESIEIVKYQTGGVAAIEDLEMEITEEEKAQMDAWLAKKGLNAYGDPLETVYVEAPLPLYERHSGTLVTDRYRFLLLRFPGRPWIK